LKYEDIKDKISIFPSYTIKLIEAYPGNKVVDKFDDDVTNENSTINCERQNDCYSLCSIYLVDFM